MNEAPRQLTDEKFHKQVHTILQRELGLGGLARFITLYHSGTGDYTHDRHQRPDNITLDEITTQIKSRPDHQP